MMLRCSTPRRSAAAAARSPPVAAASSNCSGQRAVRVLSAASFEHCKEGELRLTNDERLKCLKLLQRDVRSTPHFAQVLLRPIAAPARAAAPLDRKLLRHASRSRSRGRAPQVKDLKDIKDIREFKQTKEEDALAVSRRSEDVMTESTAVPPYTSFDNLTEEAEVEWSDAEPVLQQEPEPIAPSLAQPRQGRIAAPPVAAASNPVGLRSHLLTQSGVAADTNTSPEASETVDASPEPQREPSLVEAVTQAVAKSASRLATRQAKRALSRPAVAPKPFPNPKAVAARPVAAKASSSAPPGMELGGLRKQLVKAVVKAVEEVVDKKLSQKPPAKAVPALPVAKLITRPVARPNPLEAPPAKNCMETRAQPSASSTPGRPQTRSAPGKPLIDFERHEVLEAASQDHKDMALRLHLAEKTFCKEQSLVRWRIYQGDAPNCQCRTWILVNRVPLETTAAVQIIHTSSALAAVTVRINYYKASQGRWAQILNMSTGQERCGYGTMLIAGLEDLLKREGVDVVVLYAAQNRCAPQFWASLGYYQQAKTLLPKAELIPYYKGGPLVPEMESGTKELLPRLERRIAETPLAGSASLLKLSVRSGPPFGYSGTGERALRFKPSPLRAVPAGESKLSGERLKEVFDTARARQLGPSTEKVKYPVDELEIVHEEGEALQPPARKRTRRS